MWVRDPKWRALFASYAAELAIRDSVRCRSLIESEWYGEMFRPDWTLATDQNTKALFENTEKGFRISLGVGGKGTGYRGDAIVVDDALNAKEAFSDAALEECTFWWDQVMSSRLNDPAKGAKVLMMQRLNERDLCGHVLERGGYVHLRLPSEYEPETHCQTKIGFSDPRRQLGELLFPALFPREVIEQAKLDLGSAGYEAQHQQRPTPVGGGMLQKHWWRYWQPKGANLKPVQVKLPNGTIELRPAVNLPVQFDMILQSWDMAFKDTKKSDFVVGQVQAAVGADRYLLDQVRARMDLPATLLAVRQLSARWREASLKLVEDKANGPAVIQSLCHEIAGFVEVNPEGGKISRAAAASPQLESGNWYLPHPLLAPWVEEFIGECAAFPAGAYDDQVDAWSQGAKRLLTVTAKVVRPHRPEPFGSYGEQGWMAS